MIWLVACVSAALGWWAGWRLAEQSRVPTNCDECRHDVMQVALGKYHERHAEDCGRCVWMRPVASSQFTSSWPDGFVARALRCIARENVETPCETWLLLAATRLEDRADIDAEAIGLLKRSYGEEAA